MPFALFNKDNLSMQVIAYFISITIGIIASELYLQSHPIKVVLEGESIYIYSILRKSCFKIDEISFVKAINGMHGSDWGRVYKIGFKQDNKLRTIQLHNQAITNLEELIVIINSKKK